MTIAIAFWMSGNFVRASLGFDLAAVAIAVGEAFGLVHGPRAVGWGLLGFYMLSVASWEFGICLAFGKRLGAWSFTRGSTGLSIDLGEKVSDLCTISMRFLLGSNRR